MGGWQAAELPVHFQTQAGYETTELLIQMSQFCTLCLNLFRYAISGKITILPCLGRREYICEEFGYKQNAFSLLFIIFSFFKFFFLQLKIMFYSLHPYCIFFIIKHNTKILFKIPSL